MNTLNTLNTSSPTIDLPLPEANERFAVWLARVARLHVAPRKLRRSYVRTQIKEAVKAGLDPAAWASDVLAEVGRRVAKDST